MGEVAVRSFCVDRGVRNHIIALACRGIPAEYAYEELVKVTFRASRALARVIMKGDSFSIEGRKGSGAGLSIIQLIIAPPMIAPLARNNMGVVVLVSSSEVNCSGRLLFGEVRAVRVRRIE